MADEAVIVAESLRKVFRAKRRRSARSDGDVVAVDDVSLVVRASESLGIAGESGSGKTTLARMVAGLEQPTSGTVRVCDEARGSKRPRRRDRVLRARQLQMVFQDPYLSLDPRQRVVDAVGEVLRLHYQLDSQETRKRAAALLNQVGLDEVRTQQRPRFLSGGERQRAAIARAMAPAPRILVLDEAVSALDVSIQAQILNLLIELRQASGAAYLFVSHDLAVVQHVTERLLVMQRGRVVEEGPTQEVLSTPQHPYTQRLLLSVPKPGWKPRRFRTGSETDTRSQGEPGNG